GAKRTLEGMRKIERRVGDRERLGDTRRRACESHRPRRRRRALIGELQGYGALARKQHVAACESGKRCFARALDRQQIERAVRSRDAQRPAAAQRVDCARRPAGALAGRVAQKENSVTSGIWSEGRSQLRAGWTTRCAIACSLSAGVTHI